MLSLRRFRCLLTFLLLLPLLSRPAIAQDSLPGGQNSTSAPVATHQVEREGGRTWGSTALERLRGRQASEAAQARHSGKPRDLFLTVDFCPPLRVNPLGLTPSDQRPDLPSLEGARPASGRRKPLASGREKLLYAGGIALLTATDRSTLRWFDSDLFKDDAARGDLPRTSSDLASGWPLLVELVVPYLVDGRYGRESAKLALGATLNALVVVQPLKMVFGKERPDQALGGIRFHGPSGHYDSFPSGHTAIAFAIATVYGQRYRRWKIPVYLLATGVALARVEAGRHYLSDVFTGAGIGVLAGRASLRGGGRLISWRF